MLATAYAAAVAGVDAHLVRVEADTAAGFPRFVMLGLADSAVRESEGRIRAALRNCGYDFKWDRRITVNLAPADLPKVGSSYDLATALGLLAADGALPAERLGDVLLVAELALDGTLRPVSGVLPMALAARRGGLRTVLVAPGNLREAALVGGLDIHAVADLPAAVALCLADPRPAPPVVPPGSPAGPPQPDLADVLGQPVARRALEIAAAGGHNLLLVGPPGSGKTMLARRLPGLLPALTAAEALESTAIHSAWGRGVERLLARRPFRSPHHTLSAQALVGGGSPVRPGEASLAHNGVLFLDELPEFRRAALEALRQPLEEQHVDVARVRGSLRLPARFQLVAALNPCPCGLRGQLGQGCRCTPQQVAGYLGRLSGPLLDRIDLHAELQAPGYVDLCGPPGEASAVVRERVASARARQARRNPQGLLNAELPPSWPRRWLASDRESERLLAYAVDRLGLSGRGHERLLRVALTIADLAGDDAVQAHQIAEALGFRNCLRHKFE